MQERNVNILFAGVSSQTRLQCVLRMARALNIRSAPVPIVMLDWIALLAPALEFLATTALFVQGKDCALPLESVIVSSFIMARIAQFLSATTFGPTTLKFVRGMARASFQIPAHAKKISWELRVPLQCALARMPQTLRFAAGSALVSIQMHATASRAIMAQIVPFSNALVIFRILALCVSPTAHVLHLRPVNATPRGMASNAM
mmetsp:Transcript_6838/g.25553  ORF Transcript_6838/g.25553 Transcript_6838/m.25553 type:complete len:203 (+) Transcript_6838:333-941(+)